ncbi:thioesterase [Thelephora terrestris]|uniref:Thioesterase n=1 Tax=Thelephora terrestris TaxID=56493 RepID=A0A9P6L282_9AGAM|nr:thioesterase [Thelephora terrestris]
MSSLDRKGRKRSDYGYFLSYRTRWSDNDQYSHMNNAVYYHLYDSIINDYLAKHCGVKATSSSVIGLVVTSSSDFYRPVGYPQVLELGLRVSKLGKSSVTYEVGVFEEGVELVAAVGGYTHVFVERSNRKPGNMSSEIRAGLEKLALVGGKL